MVQPINYSMDVLGPIEGYLQGIKFGEGINTERLGQEATRQNMGIQREQMDLAQAQFAAQERARAQQMAAAQAAAQAQQAQAQAGRDALMGYLTKLEEGTATPADLRRGMAAFPQLADQFQAFASSVSEERLNNEVGFGKQLAFALANDNVDAAANLLRTRQEAAEAAGDAQGAAVYKAQLLELEQNPNGLLMQTLMPLVNTMGEDFDAFHNDVLGLGGGAEAPAGFETLRLRAEAAGLQPGTPEYQRFMAEGSAPQTNINVNTGDAVDTRPITAAPAKDYQRVWDEEAQTYRDVVIPGTETALRLANEARAGATGADQQGAGAGLVLGNIEAVRRKVMDSNLPTTGMGGSVLMKIPGTDAYDVSALVSSLNSNIAFDRLQAMRDASPTGGALGAVSAPELELLRNSIASLDQAQSEAQFLRNLSIVEAQYENIMEKAQAYPNAAQFGFSNGADGAADAAQDDDAFLRSLGLEP